MVGQMIRIIITDFNDILIGNKTSKLIKNGKICGVILFEKKSIKKETSEKMVEVSIADIIVAIIRNRLILYTNLIRRKG